MNMRKATVLLLFFSVLRLTTLAHQPYVSAVWRADQGRSFQNPVIYADYSDPDVCVGKDGYYMTASSFNCVPGLPILYSTDLVNWTIVGHALQKLVPEEHFNLPQHGNGVWAPAIRYHNDEYYIYWGDPDFGIYMVKTDDPRGRWQDPVLVKAGRGLIDACPLWDEDGRAWLSFAFAGSRRGLKSVLLMTEMTPDGTRALGQARIIYDGHRDNPTIEGTKLYKYQNHYYIFSPAGGVSTGWQEVLRAEHPFGPWQAKTVMAQGNTDINGPHQGGWVRTSQGEDWFIHFQDVGVVGRIVHLNPMVWGQDGWPVIGLDADKDGVGEPVRKYRKPAGLTSAVCTPQESDEFDCNELGLQWQWQANPQPEWYFLDPTNGGRIRLFAADLTGEQISLWDASNLLLQKFPAADFTATAKVVFEPKKQTVGERGGLVVMGMDYATLGLEQTAQGLMLTQGLCQKADRRGRESQVQSMPLTRNELYLRVSVKNGRDCRFAYSIDGRHFTDFGEVFQAREGKWIGAKVGMYCTRSASSNDSGWLDVESFTVTK